MRRIVAITISLFVVAGFALAWVGASAPPSAADDRGNHYSLSIDEGATRAEVEADLWQSSNTLSMFDVSAVPGLPNGHVDLVENLEVRDASGNVLSLRDLGEGDYAIAGGQRIRLRYAVRLQHDDYAWPAGIEEVAYHTDEGLMIGGSRLFFADGEAQMQGPITVAMKLPKGWRANTPWSLAPESSTHESLAHESLEKGDSARAITFAPSSRRDLLSNVMFLGTAHSETVDVGGVALTLVLGKRYVASKNLFVDLLRTQLASYRDLFQADPLSKRYLIVINQGATGDGGAFSSSFSQFIKGDADPINRVNWGYVMAHELLHFWNGLSLVPRDDREEWFKEGFTDYLTITTLARNGLIDESLLFKRLENVPRRYLLARVLQGLNMSLREAGRDKQPNRLLVYGGGSLTAMALDAELRHVSSDRVGLPHLMAALYAEFGKPGLSYTLDDIKRIAEQISGHDFDAFFAQTVESGEFFDISPSLTKIGLRMDSFLEEIYISRDANAGEAERARFAAIFAADSITARRE